MSQLNTNNKVIIRGNYMVIIRGIASLDDSWLISDAIRRRSSYSVKATGWQ